MSIKEIEKKAATLKNQLGGTIFAFPIEEENPLSKYALSIHTGEGFRTFSKLMSIEEVAMNIKFTLEMFAKDGLNADYEKNVRFISYESQYNAPTVTMRRLKKKETQKPIFQKDKDVIQNGDDYGFTARGVIKMSYLSMVDDKLPKAKKFMIEYYKLLSMRKYGKTVTRIKKEVDRMGKDEAITWIEKTYEQYIHDDMEVINIMNLIK